MASQEAPINDFGLIIAYVIPGFTTLWGISYLSPEVHSLIRMEGAATPTLGGFLYTTIAAVAAGLIISTVRWAVLDTIHGWTGVRPTTWDFSRFQDKVGAYTTLNEIHYKYYQFHGNLLAALIFLYVARRVHLGFLTAPLEWLDIGFTVLAVVLFAGSRDTLRKFYARTGQVLKMRASS